jgi:hypothetical protein
MMSQMEMLTAKFKNRNLTVTLSIVALADSRLETQRLMS